MHEGVACDGCSAHPIRGGRWKCSVCANFDLCDSCYAQVADLPMTSTPPAHGNLWHAPRHAFLRINHPAQTPAMLTVALHPEQGQGGEAGSPASQHLDPHHPHFAPRHSRHHHHHPGGRHWGWRRGRHSQEEEGEGATTGPPGPPSLAGPACQRLTQQWRRLIEASEGGGAASAAPQLQPGQLSPVQQAACGLVAAAAGAFSEVLQELFPFSSLSAAPTTPTDGSGAAAAAASASTASVQVAATPSTPTPTAEPLPAVAAATAATPASASASASASAAELSVQAPEATSFSTAAAVAAAAAAVAAAAAAVAASPSDYHASALAHSDAQAEALLAELKAANSPRAAQPEQEGVYAFNPELAGGGGGGGGAAAAAAAAGASSAASWGSSSSESQPAFAPATAAHSQHFSALLCYGEPAYAATDSAGFPVEEGKAEGGRATGRTYYFEGVNDGELVWPLGVKLCLLSGPLLGGPADGVDVFGGERRVEVGGRVRFDLFLSGPVVVSESQGGGGQGRQWPSGSS